MSLTNSLFSAKSGPPQCSASAPMFPLPLGGGGGVKMKPSSSLHAAPPSPHPAAAGVPARKKPGPVSAEEEELTNIPSLQMRVRILQQRVRKIAQSALILFLWAKVYRY